MGSSRSGNQGEGSVSPRYTMWSGSHRHFINKSKSSGHIGRETASVISYHVVKLY